MSTHRRAWKQRAGVVVALVVGALLAVPATPASAAPPDVSDVSASPGSVEAGKTTTVSYTLTFEPGGGSADISFTSSNSKLTCVDKCARGNVKASGTYDATFKLADDAASGTARITVKATESGLLAGTSEGSTTVTLVGKPKEVQTVQAVSGKVVKQADGSSVPNAVVMLQDGNGKRFEKISDDSGNFRFTGTSDKPIAPGRLALGASFDNVVATKSFNASAGQSITGQRLSLALKVEVTPSATPSASEEPLPTDEATDEAEETPEATAGAANNASNSDGGGMGSYLIILLGGLLVAAGVGTIVLLWMKRRENADDGDAAAPAGAAAAAGAVPAARGAYRGADDQTRVVNGVGAGPDRTMVAGGSLADAPTMMHRPVVDDVPPDPYGAPPSQQYGAGGPQSGWAGNGYGDEPAGPGGYAGGYGNAPSSGGGYGNAPSSGGGYGNAPSSGGGYGNAPSSGGGYGSRDYGAPAGGAAGYPPPPAPGGAGYGERYDEPTGRYTGDATQYPAPADPYATGTYQPEQGGYGQPDPAPYGRGAEPTGGYDQGGYGEPDAAPYGRGAEPTGGYGQQGGYGQEPPAQRGGYDQGGGYEQGGYYGDQPHGGRGRPDGPPPQDRGGRRLDWLDD